MDVVAGFPNGHLHHLIGSVRSELEEHILVPVLDEPLLETGVVALSQDLPCQSPPM